MRILQVIHQFPPFSSQGSEVYCYQLARYLTATDQVGVFHISNTQPRRPHRLVRDTYDGIATFHCIDGGEYARVADWPNRFLQQQFEAVLTEYQPEIVHFHNYLSLGDDLVSLARARGAKVVYTLHDYGLICPNNLLLRSDGQLCSKQHGDFFQDCCPVLIRTSGGQVPGLAAQLPSLSRWRLFANQFPQPQVRQLLQWAVKLAERWLGDPAHTDVDRKREFYLRQTRRLFATVDLFLAPSEFLRRRYMSCGIDGRKIHYVRCGMRRFEPLTPSPNPGPLRFGYIGALHSHKGIEVLLEAFTGLGDRASLHIYGSTFGSPISESYWQRISRQENTGVVIHGRYDNAKIGEILVGLDAVVVPSIWFENSPLTIQEAFIAGVPVITSNQGGMAELVRDRIDGRHFQIGDVADLRRVLQELIEDPEQLQRLRVQIPPVPTIADQAAVVRGHYLSLLGRNGADHGTTVTAKGQ